MRPGEPRRATPRCRFSTTTTPRAVARNASGISSTTEGSVEPHAWTGETKRGARPKSIETPNCECHDVRMRSRPEAPIPASLAPFDRGLAELSDANGMVVGHIATTVEPARNLFFRRIHLVWLLITWTNGKRERIIEDYEPWTYVAQLQDGWLLWDDLWDDEVDAPATRYEARWLAGDERDEAWRRYGIHEPVGHYIGPHEARALLDRRLTELRQQSYEQLRDDWLGQADSEDYTGANGEWYQVETQALWDDKKAKHLRVVVSVDEDGKSLTDSFIIAPDGSFIGE